MKRYRGKLELQAFWLTAALMLLCAGTARAGGDPAGSVTFRSYGSDQGLLNQAVTSLAQDGAGFVYAGTEDGLFRFDGERFQRFGAADGLPGDGISLLHATARGQLWVGSAKGLVRWSASADRAEGAVQLPGKDILGIASGANGAILVATTAGFFEASAARPALLPVAGLPAKAGAAWLSADGSQALLAVEGALWQRIGNAAWRSRPLPPERATQAVQAIVGDRRGRIWLRGRQMLLRLDDFDGVAVDLTSRLPGAAVQKGELMIDRDGRVWAPSNHGIAAFDGDAIELFDVAHGLPNEWATTVAMDHEGSLWVASEGVHRLLGRGAWTAHTRRQGLPSDTVWSVFRDRQGSLWAATNSGVARATQAGWTVQPEGAARSFYAFAESVAGDLWIGGNTGEASGNTLLLRRTDRPGFEAVALASAKGASTVNSLAFGPDGALYVATMAHGMQRLRAQGDGFRSEHVALPGGAANEQVNQLARAGDGHLWAASLGGLLVLDGRHWRRFGAAQGLRETEIETVAPADARGDMWLSYWNLKGLTRVRIDASGRLLARHVTAPAMLTGDTIYSSGSTAAGGLWLGTAMGIKRWQGRRVQRFTRADGLPGDDAAANGFWGDRNGDAWFGMANGLAHFNARREPGPTPAPRSLVTSAHDGAGRLLRDASPAVAWKDRALTFQFAVLSYLDRARLQRQVRLLGLEDTWRDTGVNEARFTGLLPGRYTFQVRARLGDTSFGPIATRQVEVLAPWWLSWWFALLVLFAGLLALRGVLHLQTAHLSRRNAQLAELVASRTRDLQLANAALEESSMVDPLTGLKNRRYLKAFMPEELAQTLRLQSARPRELALHGGNIDLCVLMVDLDHFKSVNDSHGHAAGDAVLRQVGEVLLAACRASDVVVRWGGEEFLVLARHADRHQAGVLAEQICEAMRAHAFDLGDGVVLHRTCSLGFTAFPLLPSKAEEFSWEQTVELADQCLYAAKHSGRDGWVGCLLLAPEEAYRQGPAAGLRDIPEFGRAEVLTSLGDAIDLRWDA